MNDAVPFARPAGPVEAHPLPELPPLAWLAEIVPAGAVTLLHGRDVETFRDGCFEGCWAGDFAARGFDASPHVFGSGLKALAGGALFVTPSHTTDALYALRRDGVFTVSNSLAFLARFAGIEPRFDFGIGERFTSILKGVGGYERVVLEGPGWTLYRIVYENFEVRGGALRPVPKPPEPGFGDYASYKALLEGVLAAVAANGTAPGRKVRYPLLTTCSSGYDSTACAALAAPLGCRKALTLGTARGFGRADSGRAAAAVLGLELEELERPQRARGTGLEEAEFFATGMGGEDYPFLGFGPRAAGSILLTGFHGDVVWKRHAKPANDLKRKDVSGSTLTELRLRHGFVQVPVPFIGATHHDVLLRMAESEEMRPYQVGGRYDRPVPRRIAEEAGVPRGSFGTEKKAASIVFDWGGLFWSPRTLADLVSFERRVLAEQGVNQPRYYGTWAGHTGWSLGTQLVSWSAKRVRLSWLTGPVIGRYGALFRYNHPRYDNMAFLWALDRIKARYPSAETWRADRDQGGGHVAEPDLAAASAAR